MILKSLTEDQEIPLLPYRLKVLAYSKSYWSRVDYYTDHVLVAQQQGSYFGDITMESNKEGICAWMLQMMLFQFVLYRGTCVLYSTRNGSDIQHQ